VCGRLIGCVHTVEMIKWSTQHYRQDLQMKGRLCSTCVQSAGYLVLCCLLMTDVNIDKKLYSNGSTFAYYMR